jgi:hypothetical protein
MPPPEEEMNSIGTVCRCAAPGAGISPVPDGRCWSSQVRSAVSAVTGPAAAGRGPASRTSW